MKIKVIFRYWKDDVIAIFPEEPGTPDYTTCLFYEHIGQHGVCEPWHIVGNSRPATKEEYKDLQSELKNIGYDLNVIKRHRHAHIITRLNKI